MALSYSTSKTPYVLSASVNSATTATTTFTGSGNNGLISSWFLNNDGSQAFYVSLNGATAFQLATGTSISFGEAEMPLTSLAIQNTQSGASTAHYTFVGAQIG